MSLKLRRQSKNGTGIAIFCLHGYSNYLKKMVMLKLLDIITAVKGVEGGLRSIKFMNLDRFYIKSPFEEFSFVTVTKLNF